MLVNLTRLNNSEYPDLTRQGLINVKIIETYMMFV